MRSPRQHTSSLASKTPSAAQMHGHAASKQPRRLGDQVKVSATATPGLLSVSSLPQSPRRREGQQSKKSPRQRHAAATAAAPTSSATAHKGDSPPATPPKRGRVAARAQASQGGTSNAAAPTVVGRAASQPPATVSNAIPATAATSEHPTPTSIKPSAITSRKENRRRRGDSRSPPPTSKRMHRRNLTIGKVATGREAQLDDISAGIADLHITSGPASNDDLIEPIFPICDDNEDTDIDMELAVPATPPRRASPPLDVGHRSVPQLPKRVQFDGAAVGASPTRPSRVRQHRRGASVGSTSLPMDHILKSRPKHISTPGSAGMSADIERLFSGIPSPSQSPATVTGFRTNFYATPDRDTRSTLNIAPLDADNKRTAIPSKPFFASSMFQNSPGPDELPPPSF